ncbi:MULTISPECIES: LysR family transcriptional regulator [Leisingera]|uniref:LysR family transcriptional regulator n=1 Tax=Leisingera daeponensis TaxID=405746 RepID=A0ABS7NMP9_9RHOB|nr:MULTISPECIES: LysR family transcriptional regulator [Leisingera]MBY6142087.1 LysR family transcriptional regulator [Leisingera daeponensis]
MHYTLKHLHYVEAAERHQSITHAANALTVSPSSIAAAIDYLEGQSGQPLFERTPSRGIRATQFGRTFIDEVRSLLAAQARFDMRVSELNTVLGGTARIACFTPLAPILLPTILKDVRARFKNLKIEIMDVSTNEIPQVIDSGEADFALCYGMLDTSKYSFIPFFRAPPHVALSVDHPLAAGRFVTLDQLEPEPLVVLELEFSKQYLLGLFESRGLKPNVIFSARSTDMIRAMVAAGMGYAIFNIRPMTKQTYAIGDVAELPLAGDHECPSVGVLVRRGVALQPVCDAIINACQLQAMNGAFDGALIQPHVQ